MAKKRQSKKRQSKKNKPKKVAGDVDQYGSKGQKWHPDFVSYMTAIAEHSTYKGMPDAIKDDGKIQWEAPSNRKSGKYQNTHHRRRDWWRAKAKALAVSTGGDTWISDVAKRIHPTGRKPCKRCGRVMRIAYAYPNGHLIRRMSKRFPEFEIEECEEVTDMVARLVDRYGPEALCALPTLLSTKAVQAPATRSGIDAWIEWIESEYIPKEPSMLSPGAMSNAPDRFDGFHSFNRCCRGTADTGRHASNLRSYTTDRRVFEYWSDGDWIAADRLMGIISSDFRGHHCADGGAGPATADHTGPLSLGFKHRPEFRLLSKAANSAKNNRMTLWDVRHLCACEGAGLQVASWYADALWNKRRGSVRNEETALRLSKLMRDNQRVAMSLLGRVMAEGHLAFLGTLLHLPLAERDVRFENLRISRDGVTEFDQLAETARTTKYAKEQKARRLRIALSALQGYASKENRHRFVVDDPEVDRHIEAALAALKKQPTAMSDLDSELAREFETASASDKALRKLVERVPSKEPRQFSVARQELARAMDRVAVRLADMWDDDRYVREEYRFD